MGGHRGDRAEEKLSTLVKEAENKGGYEAINEVSQTEGIDLFTIREKIDYLKTRHLISKAEKKSLPIPPMTDDKGLWEQGHYTGKWYMTNQGITEIRGLIRKEHKEILELFLPWISTIIGIIGAMTGLVAVFKK